MTDASLAKGFRWIPKGMTVEYLAQAKTDLRAIANGEGIDWNKAGDVVVPVDVFDSQQQKVFTARIIMNIKTGDLVLGDHVQQAV